MIEWLPGPVTKPLPLDFKGSHLAVFTNHSSYEIFKLDQSEKRSIFNDAPMPVTNLSQLESNEGRKSGGVNGRHHAFYLFIKLDQGKIPTNA
jgi:hypothetical protein